MRSIVNIGLLCGFISTSAFMPPSTRPLHRKKNHHSISKSVTPSSTILDRSLQESSATALPMASASGDNATFLANALGYVLGFGSLMLYTPIAVRVFRQESADGLAISTWWLKLGSYTCSDIYYFQRGYPLSTYIETLTITIEAIVILGLVTYYQKLWDRNFALLLLVYLTLTAYGLTLAPPNVLAAGQVAAAALNSAALMPQFWLNYKYQTKGDYSPLTAGLAASGCAIRLFTINQLADSDPILLGSFGLALILNASLFGQILWYGMAVEGLSLKEVFAADLGNSKKPPLRIPTTETLLEEEDTKLLEPTKAGLDGNGVAVGIYEMIRRLDFGPLDKRKCPRALPKRVNSAKCAF